MPESASSKSHERNDGFSREIVSFQECSYRWRYGAPPVGRADEYYVVFIEILYIVFQRRAMVGIYLFFSLIHDWMVVGGIGFLGLYFEQVGSGRSGNLFCNGAGITAVWEIDDKYFLADLLFLSGSG